jgi:glycosyltransferase involved in cell wall biosynthesis
VVEVMRISVVTASFNGARFILKCLDSVRSQIPANSGVELEHIVVDASSKDDSINILRSMETQKEGSSECYTLRWISEPDRGQSDGFNKGVRLANGEWICWLNSDDELAPGAIRAFLKAMRQYPDADIIYGHVEFIDETSTHLKTAYTLPYHHWLIRRNVWLPPSSGTFFRRELFLREPLNPDYHYVMDVEWFLRAGYGRRGILVDQVLSQFRVSTEGKTSAMITNGSVTDRHHQERERYREKYIYSEWPGVSRPTVEARFGRRKKTALVFYYLLKCRYIIRYIRERVFRI